MDNTFLATVRVEALLVEVPIDAPDEHEARAEIEHWLRLGMKGSLEGIEVLSVGQADAITVEEGRE